MTTTRGMPEPSHQYGPDWNHPVLNPWAQEAIRTRGYSDFDEPETATDTEPVAVAGDDPAFDTMTRRRVSADAIRGVIADAMGVDVADLDEDMTFDALTDVITHDLADPQAALDALDRTLAHPEEPKAAPGQSDLAYVVREGNWRERTGLPRRRTSSPPSRTPEARRARHIANKAERLGISVADAERMTRRRQTQSRRA